MKARHEQDLDRIQPGDKVTVGFHNETVTSLRHDTIDRREIAPTAFMCSGHLVERHFVYAPKTKLAKAVGKITMSKATSQDLLGTLKVLDSLSPHTVLVK